VTKPSASPVPCASYRRLGDKSVSVPAASIWHARDDGLIEDYRVFFDLTPVYAS
jgi:hypothetical protein